MTHAPKPDTITVYGTETCADCRRSRSLLEGLGVAYDWIDLSNSPDAAAQAQAISGRTSTPVIVFPGGGIVQVEPSDRELLEELARRGLSVHRL
ncbi:glutaredoxin family protein [Sinomonas sp. JGH33]|uniref:Glutaredoxin family protein n=1 Tax=Sinomonas terricola TaxID=3110330 RepID=A0ABU5T6M5_9MICC|nr:glutaredoxin family protein [Sinomonas sp. JGH33]MEA5455210.1 glutaredoxin family protein [Sinomonas sp. JGH33]